MPIYELRGVSNDAWTCDNNQNSDSYLWPFIDKRQHGLFNQHQLIGETV